MALIRCPECGKTISDQAISCTDCGYPIQKWLTEQQKAAEQAARAAEQAAREAEAAARREEAERRRAEKQRDARAISLQREPVPKLKLILVIILGCLYVLPSIMIRIVSFEPGPINTFLYVFRDFIVINLIYIGIFLAVVRKRIPAIIVSASYIVLLVIIIIITTSPSYTYNLVSYLILFLIAGLTVVYAALGQKARNSILFTILIAALYIGDILFLFIQHPYMLEVLKQPVFYIFYLVLLSYYVISFSPDKWWRKRKAKVPPPPDMEAEV